MVRSHKHSVEIPASGLTVETQNILYAWDHVQQSGRWVILLTLPRNLTLVLRAFTAIVSDAESFQERTAQASNGGKLSLAHLDEAPPKDSPFSAMFLGLLPPSSKLSRWKKRAQEILQLRLV